MMANCDSTNNPWNYGYGNKYTLERTQEQDEHYELENDPTIYITPFCNQGVIEKEGVQEIVSGDCSRDYSTDFPSGVTITPTV
jgi:hypothetical protein